ncbi:MAG: hypothetical protein J1E40_02690 [Oscillospiraceae bacterium]|nr:hypothetical protein [Oscillospiraceae bacterium]
MVSMDDWRRNGQEKYLTDTELIFTDIFKRFSDKWEHEHCEFCMEKFSAADNDLHSGYCTSDRLHWICPECFEDFKEEFRWTVSDSKFPVERNE